MRLAAIRLAAPDSWWARDVAVDTALALAMAALVVSSALTPDPSLAYEFAEPDGWLVALALAASLPLAVRRRWPLPVLAVVASAVFAIAALG